MAEKKLKIAIFSYYQNFVNRGAERFVKELSEYLVNNGHVVDIYFEENQISDKQNNVFLKRFFLDLNSLKILFFTLTKSSNLVYKDYDVVLPINGGWQTLIIKIISFFKKYKVVVSGQSGKGWDDRVNLMLFPDLFVSTSSFQYKWAKKTNIFVKNVLIPNGINVNYYSNNKFSIKTNLKKPIILAVAALVPEKRLDLVIKAVAKTNYSLLLIGDGYFKSKIEKMCDKYLKNRYEIKKLNFDDVRNAYNIADLFVLVPQPTESFGIVFLEAMASNLPIVTQEDNIRSEIIEDAGLYVKNPKDSVDFAKVINSALKVSWKDKPLKQVLKFDWKIVGKKYENEFIKLCQK